MKKEVLSQGGAPGVSSYYSHVVKAGSFLFLAGQTAADPPNDRVVRNYRDLPDEAGRALATGDMHVDEREGPISAQAWFIFNNVKKMLEANGSSLDNIVKSTIYFRNLRKDFAPFQRVRAMFLKKDPPASTVIETPALGVNDDILIEFDCIAIIPDEK